jgi:hypothetical protein
MMDLPPQLPPYDQLLVQARTAATAEVRVAEAASAPLPDLRWRNTAIIGGTALAIGAYGWNAWWKEGLNSDFRSRNELWFGADTEFAGMDKLGHLYFSHLMTRSLVPVFNWAGNPPETSRQLSAWTIWGIGAMVEVLDGFSKRYSFSYEDVIANSIGVGTGYLLARYPEWDDVFDLRLEYAPSELSGWNPPGDYAGQRYYLVTKFDGIQALRDVPVVKYLEFGVGYGAPGYDVPDEWDLHPWARKRREVFLSIGINLSRVMADVFYGGSKSTTTTQKTLEWGFEYFQFPTHAYRGKQVGRSPPPRSVGPPPD